MKEKVLKSYVRGEAYSEEDLIATLDGIFERVVTKHYSFMWSSRQDIEECRAIAYCKCISLLQSSHVSPNRNLINFLYAGVRNDIKKYLLQSSKFARMARVTSDGSELLSFIPDGEAPQPEQESEAHGVWSRVEDEYRRIRDRFQWVGVSLPDFSRNDLESSNLAGFHKSAFGAACFRAFFGR